MEVSGNHSQVHGDGRIAEWSMTQRLRSRIFIGEDAVAAVHGQKLPRHLGRPLMRYCVVRGIRHHIHFAQKAAAVLHGALPMFTTAINARLIMSNQIPEMKGTEEMPYCIWHPSVPSEETLRRLDSRYPQMRYQIGRACAVAGYTALFMSLDILPEVAIAEEARAAGSLAILQHIMDQTLKWKVFDDYTGTLSTPIPSHLNGDTICCELLNYRQGFSKPVGRSEEEEHGDVDSDNGSDDDSSFFDLFSYDPYGYDPIGHNVTGDMGLDAPDTWLMMADFKSFLSFNSPCAPVSDTVLELLCNPLPVDLPTCDKDLLIFMAAYRGDLDRYCRLRRPRMVRGELEAIVRGIYHNTQFAKWWST
ncbi:hypothetical protein RJ55_00335 [Drechmeria coniospora]|nr:hypothetical protein RJ55_00335 [Drechmeria coniospora]